MSMASSKLPFSSTHGLSSRSLKSTQLYENGGAPEIILAVKLPLDPLLQLIESTSISTINGAAATIRTVTDNPVLEFIGNISVPISSINTFSFRV